ncbi:HpcH/HpaI aldolase family protein [Pollutimonas harenae]|uniref:2,4-dihydroxyhept-2-ene-1,7-dioic acid aldolase n=1 Tax=Pollutimonas harenae TaxID=657015 RepID=A0A853H0L9_9BURK|nr:aldolase/citrate lyase family protein [Pollutimonas harenae]NYT84815.1 2,4-dihydroxyhept-2-ene-1,7-dioic acid aldolase [Pollutimonas harenae]TEA72787.1 2,4-dihydroxyhept-2-ene-1,7-dioic acid aldolase [Pollutimonas harenae]
MRYNTIKALLRANKTVVNAWASIPSSFCAEVIANCGFDAVTVDLQHGMIDYAQMLSMFQAISTTNTIPLGRPSGSNAVEIMRILDAGAYGVICPQVDTADIARSVVAACRYPPLGARSYGPPRGLLYGGADYFAHANDEILIFIMIESKQAVENLDEILDVPGVDGVFIGPNDLSLSYGGGVGCNPQGEVSDIIDMIRTKTAARGLATGIYCADGVMCQMRIHQGFQLVNPGNDAGVLKSAFEVQLSTIQNCVQ